MLESNAIAACRKAALDDPNIVYAMKEKSLDIMTIDTTEMFCALDSPYYGNMGFGFLVQVDQY